MKKNDFYFQCRICKEQIVVPKKKIWDKKYLKRFAEKHFRDKHNEEFIDHQLLTTN